MNMIAIAKFEQNTMWLEQSLPIILCMDTLKIILGCKNLSHDRKFSSLLQATYPICHWKFSKARQLQIGHWLQWWSVRLYQELCGVEHVILQASELVSYLSAKKCKSDRMFKW